MPPDLRPELPEPIPDGILALPRHRGYPVPWFVATIDGVPDFRVIKPRAVQLALSGPFCWICGGRMTSPVAYVVGPMCAVNRTSAEPPSHVDCADWSARACPFLARPHAKRRDVDEDLGAVEPGGIMLRRNPGVALVWLTDFIRPNGDLFDIGPPRETRWYAQGRPATRDEVMHSIETGLPALEAVTQSPEERTALSRYVKRAMKVVPA